MDGDAQDLVHRLCTLAGTIMEDVSPVALIIASDPTEIILELRRAAADIETLASAAEVVSRRG